MAEIAFKFVHNGWRKLKFNLSEITKIAFNFSIENLRKSRLHILSQVFETSRQKYIKLSKFQAFPDFPRKCENSDMRTIILSGNSVCNTLEKIKINLLGHGIYEQTKYFKNVTKEKY